MKFNWGTGIIIAIVSFMCFIMYLVIIMSTNNNYRHDLVTEKYYQKELNFQNEINAEKNAKLLKSKIRIKRITKGLEIEFPKSFKAKKVKGKVFLYRPSNKQLDIQIPFSTYKTSLIVPKERLVNGRWNIEISWKHNKIDYLVKEKIVY